MVTQNVVSGESNISFYLHLRSCGDQGINSLVIQLVHAVVLLSGLSNENARVPFGSLGFLIYQIKAIMTECLEISHAGHFK